MMTAAGMLRLEARFTNGCEETRNLILFKLRCGVLLDYCHWQIIMESNSVMGNFTDLIQTRQCLPSPSLCLLISKFWTGLDAEQKLAEPPPMMMIRPQPDSPTDRKPDSDDPAVYYYRRRPRLPTRAGSIMITWVSDSES